MEEIRWRMNTMPKSNKEESIKILGEEEIIKVKNFHQSFPQYEETPLAAEAGAVKNMQQEKMSWWWLLIIALLGVTGEEMYRRNKKKKAEAAQKDEK